MAAALSGGETSYDTAKKERDKGIADPLKGDDSEDYDAEQLKYPTCRWPEVRGKLLQSSQDFAYG